MMDDNQKHYAAVRSYLLHSFQQVHSIAAAFTISCRLCNYTSQNYFHEPNQHIVTFFIQFYFAGSHTDLPAGDALIRRVSCAIVFGNGVWTILVPWIQGIVKSRNVLSYNFERLNIDLILVQVSKRNSPHKSTLVFGYGINLNNSKIKFEKDSMVVGVIWPNTDIHTNYTK
jgi:hypothetical protein